MPAWYLTTFTAVGLVGIVLIAETAPARRNSTALR